MRGEAVTQDVGRYSVKKPNPPAMPGQELPEGLPRQAAATGGDKEVAARPPLQERGSPGPQVIRHRSQSLLANRYEPLLVPLTGGAHYAHFEVEIAHPQPPDRAVCPRASRPYAIDPVPAIVITPGSPPNAASSVVSRSLTTSTRPPITSDAMRATASRTSARPAPDSPTHALSICSGSTFAASHAARTAACSASRARASPTRVTLLPPEVAVPSTERSSPTAHVVFVPPPSIPR